jgi:4-hydroxy-tetrahydrodipicolinate synthase
MSRTTPPTPTRAAAAAAAAPHSPLHGVVPPMVTPLTERQTLDNPGLERLVEHVIGGGVHGLFVLGTTGEAAALDDSLRRDLVRRTCRLVAGRVPVLVGVTDTRVAESVRMSRWAADCGADAVVVSAPFYLPLEQQELITYVETIVSRQPLPCFLYNIPQLTKTAYEPATVRRLAELPGVAGMKDSSGSMSYLLELKREIPRPDWSYFVGTEAFLADAVSRGVHGCVGGGANLAPALFVALYDAAVAGDAARVAVLQERVMMLDRIYRLAPGTASILRGLKCALDYLGVCGEHLGAPLRPPTPAERRTIAAYVDELGLTKPAAAPVPPTVTPVTTAATPPSTGPSKTASLGSATAAAAAAAAAVMARVAST